MHTLRVGGWNKQLQRNKEKNPALNGEDVKEKDVNALRFRVRRKSTGRSKVNEIGDLILVAVGVR